MNKNTKAYYSHHVVIPIDDEAYPELHCPVCGKELVPVSEECPHMLFECVVEKGGSEVLVHYLHPKFGKSTGTMEEELLGTSPRDIASKLNLDPLSTMVLSKSYAYSSPSGDGVADVVIGISFQPEDLSTKNDPAQHCK